MKTTFRLAFSVLALLGLVVSPVHAQRSGQLPTDGSKGDQPGEKAGTDRPPPQAINLEQRIKQAVMEQIERQPITSQSKITIEYKIIKAEFDAPVTRSIAISSSAESEAAVSSTKPRCTTVQGTAVVKPSVRVDLDEIRIPASFQVAPTEQAAAAAAARAAAPCRRTLRVFSAPVGANIVRVLTDDSGNFFGETVTGQQFPLTPLEAGRLSSAGASSAAPSRPGSAFTSEDVDLLEELIERRAAAISAEAASEQIKFPRTRTSVRRFTW